MTDRYLHNMFQGGEFQRGLGCRSGRADNDRCGPLQPLREHLNGQWSIHWLPADDRSRDCHSVKMWSQGAQINPELPFRDVVSRPLCQETLDPPSERGRFCVLIELVIPQHLHVPLSERIERDPVVQQGDEPRFDLLS